MCGIARIFQILTSVHGYKETSRHPKSTSALPPRADETEGSPQSPLLTHRRHSVHRTIRLEQALQTS